MLDAGFGEAEVLRTPSLVSGSRQICFLTFGGEPVPSPSFNPVRLPGHWPFYSSAFACIAHFCEWLWEFVCFV